MSDNTGSHVACVISAARLALHPATLHAFQLNEYRRAEASPGLISWDKNLKVRPAKLSTHTLDFCFERNVPGAFVRRMMKDTARRQSERQPAGYLDLQLILSHAACKNHSA
jgi:hypothetical protein